MRILCALLIGSALYGQDVPVLTDIGYVARDPLSAVRLLTGDVTGMNNTGRVTGYWSTIPSTGFVSTLSGDVDSNLTRRYGFLMPFGINRSDQITGFVDRTPNSSVVTLHSALQVLVPGVAAKAINADGVVTGFVFSDPFAAFVYSPGIGVTSLPLPSNYQWSPVAINRSQQIAGSRALPNDGGHAFVWSRDTGFQDIGALAGQGYSSGRAINRFGQVTGNASYGQPGGPPILYTPSLGILVPLGQQLGEGRGINAVGQVAGTFYGGSQQAFLYTPGSGLVDLNSLLPESAWVLNTAIAVNDFGQIAGMATVKGELRAYRLDMPLCAITVSPSNAKAAAAPALLQVSVQVGPPGCRWTPIPSDPWISIDKNGVFTTSETLTVSLAANLSTETRMGSLLIGGRMIPILQEGTGSTQKFADVPIGHIFFPYIDVVRAKAITHGCSLTEFCPDRPITQGEFAVFLARGLLGDNFPEPEAGSRFTDVAAEHPFARYINKLFDLGIATGCRGSQFCPGDAITRSQAARLLVRARFGESGVTPESTLPPTAPSYSTTAYFTDVPQEPTYFSFIQKFRDLGITNGCTTTRFCPDSIITRGEAAVFIVRSLLTPVGD